MRNYIIQIGFFYPTSIKPGDLSVKVSGSLINFSSTKNSAAGKTEDTKTAPKKEEIELFIPSDLTAPESISVTENKDSKGSLPESMFPSITVAAPVAVAPRILPILFPMMLPLYLIRSLQQMFQV